MESLIGL